MFTRKEKVSIYAGMNVIVPPLCWGAIDGARMWANLKLAFIIAVFGSVLAFRMNVKKYRACQNLKVVSFKRAVICDGLLIVVGLVFMWLHLFVPEPFSWYAFFHPQQEVIFPIGAIVICCLLELPTMLTNKKIWKAIQSKSDF